MKIQYMREYVSVVENHNFTRAAEQCYIAQPSLSKHMMDIEKELGGQLLVRTKHRVEATELGMEVYEGFRNILNRYDSLLETVERVKSGLHGVLRMGVLYHSFESYNSCQTWCYGCYYTIIVNSNNCGEDRGTAAVYRPV